MAQQLDLQTLRVDDPDGLASAAERLYQEDYTEKRAPALLWEEAIRYVEGDHWIRRVGNPVAGSWERQRVSHPRLGPLAQPVSNHIFPAVRALVSALNKNKPTSTATGRRNDASRIRARFAERLLEVLDSLNDEQELYILAALWGCCTGVAIAKDYICRDDSVAGIEYVRDPMTGEIVIGPDGKPLQVVQPPEQLTLKSAILSGFEFMCDPSVVRPIDWSWCGEASVRHIDWVRERYRRSEEGYYPENLDKLVPEVALTSTLNIWNRLRLVGAGWYDSTVDMTQSVVVKELYTPPTPKTETHPGNPRGTYVIVANGYTLYAGENPYTEAGSDLWHPYSVFRYFPFPGRFWGWGPVSQVVPLNRKINAIDAFIALVRATMMAPRILIHKGHQIPEGHITGIPGQIIEHTAGTHPPQVLQMGQLPPDIWNERQKAEEEIKYIMGAFDPYSGQRAEGAPSYSAQAFLDEKAGDVHAVTYGQWERFIAQRDTKRLRMASCLLAKNAPGLTQLVRRKIGVSDQELLTVELGDLRDSVDVDVEAGTAAPRSRVLQQQAALDLLQRGAVMLDSPEKQAKFLALFGMDEFGSDSEEIRKAQLENSMILTQDQRLMGMLIPFENHQLHVMCHVRSLVENWATMDDLAKQLAMMHIQAHQQLLFEQMMQNPQMAMGQGVMAQAQTGQMVPGSRGTMRPADAVAQGVQGNEPAPA